MIVQALRSTCADLLEEVKRVPLAHWNESVVRYFLVRHLLTASPAIECLTEWNRVDLMLPATDGAVLVEMKFFTAQPLRDHAGRTLRFKGRPSPQNYREYEQVVEKVRTAGQEECASAYGHVVAGFLVLAYTDPIEPQGRPTYASYNDGLAPNQVITGIDTIVSQARLDSESVFTCKLLEIAITSAH